MTSSTLNRFYQVTLNAISAFFFVIAAYVNLNDPDPWLWVSVYTIAAVLNIFAMFNRIPQPVISALPSLAAVGLALAAWQIVLLSRNERFIDELTYGKLSDDIWSFFETEEGRELGGLIVVSLSLIQNSTESRRQSNLMSFLLKMTTAVLLGAAVYALFVLQPLMNQKEKVAHCNNAWAFSKTEDGIEMM
ncbi:transmembrane protein [Planoprotostelium fungivorum]|uniref:Transmembrane protein n=1 Tax=Planoprotostelium fungivorum TaxID=1890364 RepID=A0A2P6NJ86_9EUKA|nr:transmembrane protein [Planoprotostelium fungivorum]